MLRRRFGQLGLGMGMGGGISGAVGYIINLLIAASTRATERTVWGLPGDGVVADGESLLTVPIEVPAITGGRLATTVEDGASLGSDIFTPATWGSQSGWTIDEKVTDVQATGVATSLAIFQPSGGIVGKYYQAQFIINNITAGSVQIASGNNRGPIRDTAGVIYTDTIIREASALGLFGNSFSGDVTILSMNEVIPVWYATDADGVPLDTSLSNYNDAINLVTDSEDVTIATTGWTAGSSGTGNGKDITFGTPSDSRIFTAAVFGAGETITLSCIFDPAEQGNTVRLGYFDGVWNYGSDLIIPADGLVSRTVTLGGSPTQFIGVVAESTNTTGYTLSLPAALGGVQAEAGPIVTAYIKTEGSTGTRDADVNTVPVSSNHSVDQGAERFRFSPYLAGQVNKYLRSFYIDATHTIDVYINATQAIAYYIDGANTDSATFTYTHLLDTDAFFDLYWDKDLNQIAIRAAAVSGDIDSETFATGTFAGMTALPATSGIGNTNGGSIAQGEFGNQGVPIDYESASKAGWL